MSRTAEAMQNIAKSFDQPWAELVTDDEVRRCETPLELLELWRGHVVCMGGDISTIAWTQYSPKYGPPCVSMLLPTEYLGILARKEEVRIYVPTTGTVLAARVVYSFDDSEGQWMADPEVVVEANLSHAAVGLGYLAMLDNEAFGDALFWATEDSELSAEKRAAAERLDAALEKSATQWIINGRALG